MIRIFVSVLIISIDLSSGGAIETSEVNINDILKTFLQPDDVDSGAYDEQFLTNITDNDNEVITRHSSLIANDNACVRECDGIPRTCYYQFKIEHFSAMGFGCGNCTCSTAACTNVSHCSNKNCITADGYHRNMITVNRRYPGPPIYVCKGDRVVVDVTNLLQGKAATLHWHGIFQKNTPWMDGVAMLSQCPVVPGTTFRYNFIAAEPGTHFWHDHTGLIKLDGVQGPLIVRDTKSDAPNSAFYDYDLPSHIIFLNDWKHFMADDEFPDMKVFPGKRIEALLINGKGLFEGQRSQWRDYYGGNNMCLRSPLATFDVERGNSYRFRIVGAFCMMCAIEFVIENHPFTVIAVDGNPIRPTTVSGLIMTSGERYDIVLNALQPVNYYWIQTRGVYPCNGTSQAALLRYKGANNRRNCVTLPPLIRTMNHPNMRMERPANFKISELVNSLPVPQSITNPKSTSKFTFVISSYTYSYEEFVEGRAPIFFRPFADRPPFRSTINNISSTAPSVPLYTQYNEVSRDQLCSAECVSGTSETPCQPCVHLVNIPYNQTVDFIIADPGSYTGIVHPFHLHGHKFYVLDQGMMGGNVTVQSLRQRLELGEIRVDKPPVKDTIIVPLGTYAIIRFFTDNPGVWIFHCHYIYHNAVGMHVFLQVGEQRDFPRPPANFPRCGNYTPFI